MTDDKENNIDRDNSIVNDNNEDKKIFFRLVTSVGQRKNSESPLGIEPQTFGFRAPILYH